MASHITNILYKELMIELLTNARCFQIWGVRNFHLHQNVFRYVTVGILWQIWKWLQSYLLYSILCLLKALKVLGVAWALNVSITYSSSICKKALICCMRILHCCFVLPQEVSFLGAFQASFIPLEPDCWSEPRDAVWFCMQLHHHF